MKNSLMITFSPPTLPLYWLRSALVETWKRNFTFSLICHLRVSSVSYSTFSFICNLLVSLITLWEYNDWKLQVKRPSHLCLSHSFLTHIWVTWPIFWSRIFQNISDRSKSISTLLFDENSQLVVALSWASWAPLRQKGKPKWFPKWTGNRAPSGKSNMSFQNLALCSC